MNTRHTNHAMHATSARDTRGFAFESTLSKVARVLTGQYGVTVAFSPDGPRVEAGRIVIPDDEMTGGVERDVLIGYLDLLVARAKHSSLPQLDALPAGVAGNSLRSSKTAGSARNCSTSIRARAGSSAHCARMRRTSAAALAEAALARPARVARRARAVERTTHAQKRVIRCLPRSTHRKICWTRPARAAIPLTASQRHKHGWRAYARCRRARRTA